MKDQTDNTGFIYFLNRNYYINSHLAERLDELKNLSSFLIFQQAIVDATAKLDVQIAKLDELFNMLNAKSSYADCEPLIAFLESLFTTVHNNMAHNPAISLLDYVSVADALIKESAIAAQRMLINQHAESMKGYHLYDSTILRELKTLLADPHTVA